MFQSYVLVTDEIPAIFVVGIPVSILNTHIGSCWGGAILYYRSLHSAALCVCGCNWVKSMAAFWALLDTRHQGCISNPIHRTVGWEWVTGWNGTQLRQQTQWTQYPIPCEVILAIKAKRKEEEWHTRCYNIWLLVHCSVICGSISWELSDITCWLEVQNKSFCFPLLPCEAFVFLLLNFTLTQKIFILFFPVQLRGGGDRTACRKPGGQPRSTQHTLLQKSFSFHVKVLQSITRYVRCLQVVPDRKAT